MVIRNLAPVLATLFLILGTPIHAQSVGADNSSTKTATSTTDAAEAECGQLVTAAAKLPVGVNSSAVCSSIITAVRETAQASPSSGRPLLDYTEDTPQFYAALAKSIRKRGGRTVVTVNTALPALGDRKASPVITLDTIQAEAAPTYTELGLGVWLDRIKEHGGAICKNTDQHFAPAIAFMVFDFLAKEVLPWAIRKYNAATAYSKASRMDAVVYYTATGPQTGRITQIDFVPRGTVSCHS